MDHKQNLCHGDFHPGNVILTDKGPYIVDWITVNQGNPLSDFLTSSLLLRIGTPPANLFVRTFIKLFRSRFHKKYWKYYLQNIETTSDELSDWEFLMAVHRLLNPGFPSEKDELMEIVNSYMSEK